jgi:hypothetical protein
MPNYQNSKIYEIVCMTTGMRYIGSTTEVFLSRRLATHVRDCKIRKTPCSSVKIIEGGNYKINLLEKFPCNDINEVTAREYEHMKNIECVNKIRGFGRNKEREKEYKMRKKDHINATRQKWRLKNKLPATCFDQVTSELCPNEITNATS